MSACAHSADRCHCCAWTTEPMCAAAFPPNRHARRRSTIEALSSEVDTGSHEENASKQNPVLGSDLIRSETLARTAKLRVLSRRLAQRGADLAVVAETKRGANAQRAGDGIFEIDAVGCRMDFLQPETGRRESAEPRLPIGFELAPAAIALRAVARAFDLGVVRIEVEERCEVTLPAGIHPIDDNSHLVEITHAAILSAAENYWRLRTTLVNVR